jgi:hypothetical protein
VGILFRAAVPLQQFLRSDSLLFRDGRSLRDLDCTIKECSNSTACDLIVRFPKQTFKHATELYPLMHRSALGFLCLDWMANLDDNDVCVRADDVKADPAWVARLETAVFGRHDEGYGAGFTPIHDCFTPMAAAGRDGLVERPLPDTRKYELLVCPSFGLQRDGRMSS